MAKRGRKAGAVINPIEKVPAPEPWPEPPTDVEEQAREAVSPVAPMVNVVIDGKAVAEAIVGAMANETAGAEIVGSSIPVAHAGDPVAMAAKAMGLAPEEVAASSVTGDSVVIVTRGGRKLRWPEDLARARALTQPERDGMRRGQKRPCASWTPKQPGCDCAHCTGKDGQ